MDDVRVDAEPVEMIVARGGPENVVVNVDIVEGGA